MTDEIESVRLGRTNLDVPKICLGTTALGDMPNSYGYRVGEQQARETLMAILTGPIKFLDTSRTYAFSEQRIGAAIKELGGLPESFVISTKLDRDMQTNRFDAAQARRSLEQSLDALGMDHVHLLHLHDPEYCSLDEVTGPNGALRALFQMKEEGLADAVGLAAGKVDVMMPLLRDWDFDVLITHNRYTLLNRSAEAMLDFAVGKGIAVINAAPYGSGILAKGSRSGARYVYQESTEEAVRCVRTLEQICDSHGIPLAAAALQFSLREPRITSTLVGISKPERIAQTMQYANWPISDAAWSELLAVPADMRDPEANRAYVPDLT